MKVVIDSHCVGHGLCYMTMPDVYEDDDDGYGRVRFAEGEVPLELEGDARSGASSCPERAIQIS